MKLSILCAIPAVLCLSVACGDDGDTPTTSATTSASGVTLTDPGLTSSTGPGAPTSTTDIGGTEVVTTDATDTANTTSTGTGTTSPVDPSDSTSTGPDIGSTTIASTDPDTTNSSSTTDADSSTGPAVCPEDELVCEGDTEKICDGLGGFKSEEACAKQCYEPLGCVECVPDSVLCEGQSVQVCKPDGSGYIAGDTCDPLLGLSCNANLGGCEGACASLGSSYIGCEYYAVVTQQHDSYISPNNPFAIAVANSSAEPASVTVHRGEMQVAQQQIPGNSVGVIVLPWIQQLAGGGGGPSVMVADGAYRVRSTRPVTVYQFNPLNADVTNDASLLLPVNTWTGNYVVASWQHWSPHLGFYAVSAMADNTQVTLKAPKGATPTQAGGGINNQGNGVVVLNQGDVLQAITANGGDLTGSIIAADKPVQVISGHECTQVPIGVTACDHLEEAMFPIETLAKEYIVVPPVQVPNSNLEKAVRVRVVASEPNTTLTFEPDQPVNKVLALAGDFVEIPNTIAKFVVKADKKILVAEYMVGQDAGFGTSDPAFILAVPTAQYRNNYLFYAQTGWQSNFVDIIAPMGAAVQVDGAPVGGFTPIGASGFSLAHVKLSNAGNGSHNVTADQKVGISVYGVVSYGSYWYAGGLDLDTIPQ